MTIATNSKRLADLHDEVESYIDDCSRVFLEKNWTELIPLAVDRDTLALEWKHSDFQNYGKYRDCRDVLHKTMRGLPLYRISTPNRQLISDLKEAWGKGPSSQLWTWALTWIPCFLPPWFLTKTWALDTLSDEDLAYVLSFLLKLPIGWGAVGESDAIATHFENLLPEIRESALRASPLRQKAIDKIILDQLDIGFAYFGLKNLCNVARHRGLLLEDVLRRRDPDLSLEEYLPPHISKGSRQKLGIVIRYFKPFIDNWVLAGFLTAMPREKFEITLYSVQDVENRINPDDVEQKAFRVKFMTLIDNYVALDALSLQDTVTRIREDRNDIILLGNAMHSGTAKGHLLQIYRLAPLEIVTTNTSSTTGLNSVDYYLSAKITEPHDAEAHYTEKLAWLSHHFYAMAHDPLIKTANSFKTTKNNDLWFEKNNIPPNSPVAISCSGWPKLTMETLLLWADILKQVPEAHLILDPFSPSWRSGWFAQAQQELIFGIFAKQQIDLNRCHIIQLTQAQKTLAAMARSSIYLDAFPYSGNMALREPLLMGCPVVTRFSAHQRGAQGAATLISLDLNDLVAHTNEEYKNIAINHLRHESLKENTRARIKSAMPNAPFYDNKSLSHDFSVLLEKMVMHEKDTGTSPTMLNSTTTTYTNARRPG